MNDWRGQQDWFEGVTRVVNGGVTSNNVKADACEVKAGRLSVLVLKPWVSSIESYSGPSCGTKSSLTSAIAKQLCSCSS